VRIAPLPGAAALLLGALASGCSRGAPAPEAENTEVPRELAGQAPAAAPAAGTIGTPMAQRVAVIGLLNKRNNISQTVEMKPGESRRVGDVVLRLSACERTPPWESPPETGAFVQVVVQERARAGATPEWKTAFSGWLFKNSPSLNVVEHPVYDVWVKDCKMSFPGEERGPIGEGADGAAPRRPAASPSATASPDASPSASTPAAAPASDT
jgi:hypothetical protein